MNLNEQIQQAIRAGRQQGLNEAGPPRGIGRRLMDIGFPTGGGGGGRPPRPRPIPPPNPGDLPDRGAIRGYIYSLDNDIPPPWWANLVPDDGGGPLDWSAYINHLRKSVIDLSGYAELSDIDFSLLWALMMRAIYNPGNDLVWGDFMSHPLFTQLSRQGWNFNVDADGIISFNFTPFPPGTAISGVDAVLHQWAQRLADLIAGSQTGQ